MPDGILRGVHTGGLSIVSGYAFVTFTIAGLLTLVLPRRRAVVAVLTPSTPPAIDFTSTGMLAFALAATSLMGEC